MIALSLYKKVSSSLSPKGRRMSPCSDLFCYRRNPSPRRPPNQVAFFVAAAPPCAPAPMGEPFRAADLSHAAAWPRHVAFSPCAPRLTGVLHPAAAWGIFGLWGGGGTLERFLFWRAWKGQGLSGNYLQVVRVGYLNITAP